ncbi:UDP-Glycosyltransferase/glycogen phosphorylase [Aspergillus recurvatus]
MVGPSCIFLHERQLTDKRLILFADDGRVDIDCDTNFMRQFSRLYNNTQFLAPPATAPPGYSEFDAQSAIDTIRSSGSSPENPESVIGNENLWAVKLNIPFIVLGNELQRYGHRVRLATHDVFRNFVVDSGLEFYPIGGDPAELMAYMIKNPGLIPGMQSLQAGEIRRKRIMIREMLDGFWRSCIEPDVATQAPFVADAIIANPPSFAHIHCAQALSIPVHLIFTMPWTSTKAFPHPLTNLNGGPADQGPLNYISYGVVNWLTWQGVGDVINQRRRELDLNEVAMFEGPHLAEILGVPVTYCWSPTLVPKPADWPSYVDVCGFFFRDHPQYDPPADLQVFLTSGTPPDYIGFGSIVVDDPKRITALIIDAVTAAGVRAIVGKGWSHLGRDTHLDNIYFIGDCPHDWLFDNVVAVVHHGGAGTTACGLRRSKPTFIIPFFGDQPFRGAVVAAADAGPPPIPYRELTVDALTQGIRYCLSEQAATAAAAIAVKMLSEEGVSAAVTSFHRNLPVERLQCDLYPGLPAVWSCSKNHRKIKLSKIAAQILVADGVIDKSLTMYVKDSLFTRHAINPILIKNRRWDPITGGASAMVGTAMNLTGCFLGTFYNPFQEYRKYRQHREDRPPTSSASTHAAQRPSSKSLFGTMSANNETEPQAAGAVNSNRSTTTARSSMKKRSDLGGGMLLGRMAGTPVKSLSRFVPIALQGMTVDIPLAMTEGLRNLPRLYGEEPRDNGPVTDVESGFTVAGKGFAWGMAEAVSDIVIKPYEGLQEDGARGAVKGVGKGVANMVAKAGCAMFGVAVYPAAGIAQSLRTSFHSRTGKLIAKQRHMEGIWLLANGQYTGTDNIVVTFQQACRGKKV